MGACCGAGLDENTRIINEHLSHEDRIESRTNKLLFLGPGGSGKSTIFKQLQWLHGGGFDTEDALMLKEHIYCQINTQMKKAIKAYVFGQKDQVLKQQNKGSIASTTTTSSPSQPGTDNSTPQSNQQEEEQAVVVDVDDNNDGNNNTEQQPPRPEMLGVVNGTEDNVTYSGDEETTVEDQKGNFDEISMNDAIATIMGHADVTTFTDELAEAIKYVWKYEQRIKDAFEKEETAKNKILDETTAYFWNEIDRVRDPQYVPNENDIIKVRYRTTGVIEKKFEIKGAKFHIFDVGGQKSERKKWIHCFNEVKAVIFVISLSCYNELMFEDLNKNCMVDSLELFGTTINNKHFTDTHIILFLNKRDLFQDKITKVPITTCPAFTDFKEWKHSETIHSNPNDYEQTTAFIKYKFESLNKSPKRKQIYTHLTCGLSKANIENVFNDVKHIVITDNLLNEGLS